MKRERARPGPVAGWGAVAGRRLGAFTLALLCGVALPLSPLAAEYFVTGDVVSASWSAVGVTYAAGVGLVSRSQTILVSMLLAASLAAFMYGVDLKQGYDHMLMHMSGPPAPTSGHIVKWVIGLASMLYIVERCVRHVLDGQPFLEA